MSLRWVVACVALLALLPAPAGAAVFPVSDPATSIEADVGYSNTVLDFNGDSYWDLAGLSRAGVYVALGSRSGLQAIHTTSLPDSAGDLGLVAGDVTGDGRDDLLLSFGTSSTLVLVRGRADGRPLAPPDEDRYLLGPPLIGYSAPTAVALGDIDGDEDLDVAASLGVKEDSWTPPNTSENGHVLVFTNDGTGKLTPTGQTIAANAPGSVQLLALGADDDPELLVSQRNVRGADLKVYPGLSGASFGAPAVYAAGGAPVAGDFNADGLLDLAVGHGAGAQITILPGTGGAGLGAPVSAPGRGDNLAAGDLDLDGRDDLYIGNDREWDVGYAGHPGFLHGLGAFAFAGPAQAVESGQPDSNPQIVDVDGDGRPDVVATSLSAVLVRWGLGPQLVPDPSSTDFPDQTVGTSSAPRTITFTNESGGPAAGLELVVDGDADDFPVALGDCATRTLDVGDACTVSLRFAPTAAGGRGGQFGLAAADSDIVWMHGLYGEGVAAPPPRATPAPSPIPSATPPPFALQAPQLAAVKRSALPRHGLRFRQRFTAAGRARWTLEWPARHALGTAAKSVKAGATVNVTIRLTAKARRALKARRPKALMLRTRFLDAQSRQYELVTRVPLKP